MKSIDSVEIAGFIEEADEDALDARKLSGRSAPAARYAASQAAEKYLRAVCEACDRPAGVMWDITKIYETVKDIGDVGQLESSVALLSRFTTPARSGDGTTVRMPDVIHALARIRWTVRGLFGVVEPEPDPPSSEETPCNSCEVIDSAVIPEVDDMIPTVMPDDPAAGRSEAGTPMTPADEGRSRERRDLREGRSDQERNTSFVKTFLVCDRCGVRIPRTRQTAQGRIPCAMCGRPMKLQR